MVVFLFVCYVQLCCFLVVGILCLFFGGCSGSGCVGLMLFSAVLPVIVVKGLAFF